MSGRTSSVVHDEGELDRRYQPTNGGNCSGQTCFVTKTSVFWDTRGRQTDRQIDKQKTDVDREIETERKRDITEYVKTCSKSGSVKRNVQQEQKQKKGGGG